MKRTWQMAAVFAVPALCRSQGFTGARPINALDLSLLTGAGIVAFLCLNAAFIASEAAVSALRPIHVKHVKEEGSPRSARLQDLIDQRKRYVTACLLASRLARLGLFLVVVAASEAIADRTEALNMPFAVLLWALAIGLPVLLLNLIVGELIPRSFASLHPHRVGIFFYSWVRLSSFVLSLPANLLTALAGVITARFGGRAAFEGSGLAEDEILNLVESAEETGEIESDERELLHSVFEFNDTVASEIMTPRVDLDAMPVRADPSDVVKVIRDTGHSRIPLYEDTDDQIVGIIHAKDLLLAMASGGPLSLRTLMRPPLFVPEGKSLHELLQEMRASRSQMAILQDEFGGTAGIVTTEDIVEQLVGEIVDEYDEEEVTLVRMEHGWYVSGKTRVDDVNDALGSTFDSEEFDTIGGLVFGQIGRQPKVGEKVDIDGFEFSVEETDGRRILRLLIEPSKPAPPSEETVLH